MQKFNYHSHTYRCKHADLDFKDEEYVKDYIKMGFKKIAFTDHCPEKNEIDKRQRMRMKYEEKNDYLKSVKRLKEKYADKIEIKSGYEVEYLPGEEENIKDLKQETDIIILGQHFVYDDNKELKIFGKDYFSDNELIRYVEYIEKAMKNNIPNIIAHPDIFMLGRREFGNIENKISNMIFKAAEKYNIPLEINLNNIFRNIFYTNKKIEHLSIEEQKRKLRDVIYPCKEFWNIATKYNVKVLYGIDTHHRGQILLWNELVNLANEILGKEIIEKLTFIEEI